MQRNFLVYLFLMLASTAFGQATLRVGDPLELRVGGVPPEEQAQMNNVYTIDASGSVGGKSRDVVGFGGRRSGSGELGAIGEIVGVYRQVLTDEEPADGLAQVCPVRTAWRRCPESDARATSTAPPTSTRGAPRSMIHRSGRRRSGRSSD